MNSFITITAGPSSALLESVSFGSFNILPKIECGTFYNAQMFNLKKNVLPSGRICRFRDFELPKIKQQLMHERIQKKHRKNTPHA